MNVFIFDIETVPDVASAKKLNNWQHLSDTDVAQALFAQQRTKTGGSEFLPLYMHRIVAISVVYRWQDNLKVWSLGDLDSTEAELIERFYQGIARYQPTIVSWNGGGFDLPVLHYRSLLNDISAPEYWETGDSNQSFRYNNYLNRYHSRHLDLMDVLAGYQARANAPLDQIAAMLGFPGKMGMSGAKVWDTYLDGDLAAIRNYCETDVLNTYLVYLRFEKLRGNLDTVLYQKELELVKQTLSASEAEHLQEFLAAIAT